MSNTLMNPSREFKRSS